MVATAWGLFYYREFRGLDASTALLIAGMYVWYTAAIVLVVLSLFRSAADDVACGARRHMSGARRHGGRTPPAAADERRVACRSFERVGTDPR